ncbi:hypothetical protein [Streptomyces sp. NPDC007856]|uniref:hypothetical protein n=1 Tax=Streptomyces sp. NPDC007856 TaxID=3364781 RepID=UPI0036C004C1
MPNLTKAPRKRARRALSAAQTWLAQHDGATLPPSQRAVVAGMTLGHYVKSTEEALKEARESAGAAKRAQQNQEAKQLARAERHRHVEELAARAKRPAAPPRKEDPVGRLTRELVDVAARGGTVTFDSLSAESGLLSARDVLVAVDRTLAPGVPLLSALVTGAEGGPVAFFRDVLRSAGLAVPQTDEALQAIWLREQEHAHAAYANPSRPVPPRLVPPASQVPSTM